MQVWRGQLSFQVPADSSIQSPAGCSSLRTMLAGSCRQGMCTQEKEDSYQSSFLLPMKQMHFADSSIQSPAGCSSLRTMLAGSCRQGMCTQEKEDSYQSSFLLPMKQMHLAWAEMSLTGMD